MKTLALLLAIAAPSSAQLAAFRAAEAPAPSLSAPAAAPAFAAPAFAAPAFGPSAAPSLALAPSFAPAFIPAPSAAPAAAPEAKPTAAGLAAWTAAAPDLAKVSADESAPAAAADFLRLSAAMSGEEPTTKGGKADAPRLMKEKALKLRPTQMSVGMREVADKAEHLRGMKSGKADDYLKEHPVPVVLGPQGRIYLIDHHHLVRAAWEAGIETVHLEVKADLSNLDEDAFWKKMTDEKWVYPYDQFGKGPHDPRDLPETVRGLADDPFRSVAGAVRDAGGYQKTGAPFSEFLWANFLRERLKTHPVFHDFDAAVKEAIALAKTEAAKRLPGWLGGR